MIQNLFIGRHPASLPAQKEIVLYLHYATACGPEIARRGHIPSGEALKAAITHASQLAVFENGERARRTAVTKDIAAGSAVVPAREETKLVRTAAALCHVLILLPSAHFFLEI